MDDMERDKPMDKTSPGMTIGEMVELQKRLHERYRDKWGELSSRWTKDMLLWMMSEAGEAAEVIKHHHMAQILAPGEVRDHFVEELCDVLMYFVDVMLCAEITPEELSSSFRAKFEKNMGRW